MHKHQLAELIYKAAEIREQSFVQGEEVGLYFRPGYYIKTPGVAAQEAAEVLKLDKDLGRLVGLLLTGTWNEALQWADAHRTHPCTCKFVAPGVPMDHSTCKIHDRKYRCDECGCNDYRPHKAPTKENPHPRCTCGHIAQDHN